jgi:hypothetical protein
MDNTSRACRSCASRPMVGSAGSPPHAASPEASIAAATAVVRPSLRTAFRLGAVFRMTAVFSLGAVSRLGAVSCPGAVSVLTRRLPSPP